MIAPDVERAAGELRACLGPLVRRLRQVQVDGELTLSQVSVLVRLEREGPSTPGALAAVEQITPQSMGAILAALAQGGLVSRSGRPVRRAPGAHLDHRRRPGKPSRRPSPKGPAAGPSHHRNPHPGRATAADRGHPTAGTLWFSLSETALLPQPARGAERPADDRYKWVALTNTSLGMFMAVLDSSIVIIAMPAIFRGIGLNPLAPGNITYLLWMIMGYLLVVTAVLVVSLGRLGDMFGRVRIYNLGFVVFTCASIALSLDPARRSAAPCG